MHVRNLKMACGHWAEWLMPGGYSLDEVYGAILTTEVCPRCLARETSQKVARDIQGEYHRTLCRRPTAPDQLSRPFFHRSSPSHS